MVILLICFNFGALVLTNIMVSSADESKCFNEFNPIMSKINDLKAEPTEEFFAFFKSVIFQGLFWGILIGSYIYLRNNYSNNLILYLLTVVISFLFMIWGWDFFSNLGHFIGVF